MENEESNRWVYTPGPFTFPLRFKFTAEETENLGNILKSFEPNKVKGFLFIVSTTPFIPLFAAFKSRTFPKDAIEGHLRNMRQCEKTLEKILMGFNPDPQRNFDSLRDSKIRLAESPWAVCFENAEKAKPHIKAIRETLQGLLDKNRRRRGRPQADAEGFVSEVAKLYKRFFGREPGTNRNTIFYNLIAELFNILNPNDNGHDVSRAVHRALKKN